MARILKETALNSKLTPHSLRHTHTSLLAEAGVGLEEIMERLGHHNDEVFFQELFHKEDYECFKRLGITMMQILC